MVPGPLATVPQNWIPPLGTYWQKLVGIEWQTMPLAAVTAVDVPM
jgi:hypothetical protein